MEALDGQPDGYLGKALSMVAAAFRSKDDLTFRQATRHRAAVPGAVEKRMSADSRKRIDFRARNKVLDWAGDVADVLAEWIACLDEITAASAGGSLMDTPIAQLRTTVVELRGTALAELEALAISLTAQGAPRVTPASRS